MAQESVLRIVIDSRNAERNARNVARELQNIERNGDYASRSMDSMSVATRQLAGYMAGVVTVGAAISKMDAYTGMQNRLKLVTESQEQLNQAMGDTFSIAQKSYQSWDSVIQVYQRFSDNAKTLNIDMAKTAELTETVSKAVAISGASTQAAEAALTQFGQALASGVLRGEELNSILEQTPALAKAIAQGMGITVGELRSVAAEGKITGDVLVEALTKSKASVDELFSRTDVTIGQSLTLLNNEITKFVGEAGQASGAASVMADSIKLLGQNLSTIADAAVLGGIAYLTKAIITQTTSIYGYVTASAAQRAATITQQQASIAAATATLNEAKAHLANVQATNAETQSKYGATAAAVRYKVASDAVTQALLAQAAAQGAANGAATIGSRALALVGGPIGAITLGVTALAAGYMYMQSRTAEANAKLEEQAKVANKTKEELLALEGAQRKSAQVDLATAFAAQNKELNALNQQFNAAVISVQNYAVKNQVSYESLEKIREISSKVRQGLISQEEAIKQINNLYFVTPDQIKQIKNLNDEYEIQRGKTQNTADAQSVYGTKVTLAGNAASNAAAKVRDKAGAMDEDAASTRNAANAQSEYIKSLSQTVTQTQTVNNLIAKGMSPERAKALSEAYFKNNQKLSATDVKLVDANIAANKKLQASEDAIANAKRGSAKAASAALSQHRKDAKEADRLAEDQAKSRIDIDYRYLDEFKKFRADYLREVEEINKANFGSETSSMLKKAEEKYLFEEEMYLRQVTEEINAHKWSENQKLKYFYETQRIIVSESGKYNDEIKNLKLNALKEQEAHELGLIQLAKEQRIFQAEQAMMTEIQFMKERYRLEREEIIKTTATDLEERKRKLNALNTNTIRDGVGKNFSDPDDRGSQFLQSVDYAPISKSNSQRLDEEFEKEQAKMLANFEKVKQLNADNHEAILEAERQFLDAKQQLQDEYDFKAQDARRMDYEHQLSIYGQMTSMVGSSFGQMMDIVSQVKEENTKTYKTFFAINKAIAFAQAIINTEEGATKALAQGGIYGAALAMAVRASGYASAGIIAGQAIAGPGGEGYANGGYTGHGGKYDPAGIVHKGEGVLTQEEIKALGGPQGFEDLRKSIRRGYATGGLVADTRRVGINTLNAINNGGTIQAEKQAQASAKAQSANPQPIDNQIRVAIFDDRADMMNQMYGREGEKVVMYHLKRNGMLKA